MPGAWDEAKHPRDLIGRFSHESVHPSALKVGDHLRVKRHSTPGLTGIYAARPSEKGGHHAEVTRVEQHTVYFRDSAGREGDVPIGAPATRVHRLATEPAENVPISPGPGKPVEHRVTLPDGTVATRSSARTYTHAVTAYRPPDGPVPPDLAARGVEPRPGGHLVHTWSMSAENAEKARRQAERQGYQQARVVPVERGDKPEPPSVPTPVAPERNPVAGVAGFVPGEGQTHATCRTGGETLPLSKFPTMGGGRRGTECREHRDARRAALRGETQARARPHATQPPEIPEPRQSVTVKHSPPHPFHGSTEVRYNHGDVRMNDLGEGLRSGEFYAPVNAGSVYMTVDGQRHGVALHPRIDTPGITRDETYTPGKAPQMSFPLADGLTAYRTVEPMPGRRGQYRAKFTIADRRGEEKPEPAGLPKIRRTYMHDEFPTVEVEPHRTTDDRGRPVEVHEFYQNGSLVSAEGFLVKKDGTTQDRRQVLTVAAPEHVREALRGMQEPEPPAAREGIIGIQPVGSRVRIEHEGHPHHGETVTVQGRTGATGGSGGGGSVTTDKGPMSRYTRVVPAEADPGLRDEPPGIEAEPPGGGPAAARVRSRNGVRRAAHAIGIPADQHDALVRDVLRDGGPQTALGRAFAEQRRAAGAEEAARSHADRAEADAASIEDTVARRGVTDENNILVSTARRLRAEANDAHERHRQAQQDAIDARRRLDAALVNGPGRKDLGVSTSSGGTFTAPSFGRSRRRTHAVVQRAIEAGRFDRRIRARKSIVEEAIAAGRFASPVLLQAKALLGQPYTYGSTDGFDPTALVEAVIEAGSSGPSPEVVGGGGGGGALVTEVKAVPVAVVHEPPPVTETKADAVLAGVAVPGQKPRLLYTSGGDSDRLEWAGSPESPADVEHKVGGQTLDISDDLVVALVAVTGIIDEVEDFAEPGCFDETLRLRIPKGVWSHDWDTWVSRTEAIEELLPGDARLPAETRTGDPWPRTAGGLLVATRFNTDTQPGREGLSNVKFFDEGPLGPQTEWSIGYNVRPGQAYKTRDGVRHIRAWDVFEYGPVLFGAASLSGTLAIAGTKASAMRTSRRLRL